MLRRFKKKAERRESVRIERLKDGRIVLDEGAAPVPCRILDISTTGARLDCRDITDWPTALVLLDSAGNRIDCDVIWNAGTEIGVRFKTPRPLF